LLRQASPGEPTRAQEVLSAVDLPGVGAARISVDVRKAR